MKMEKAPKIEKGEEIFFEKADLKFKEPVLGLHSTSGISFEAKNKALD